MHDAKGLEASLRFQFVFYENLTAAPLMEVTLHGLAVSTDCLLFEETL